MILEESLVGSPLVQIVWQRLQYLGEWNVDVMDADSLRAKVRQVVEEQERFCQDVQAAVAASRDIKRKIAQGKAVLPKFCYW